MLETIYYHVDNFCKDFEPTYMKMLLEQGIKKRIRKSKMTLSEILTIIIYYHYSGMKTFKYYYNNLNPKDYSDLVSYNRFIELMQESLIPLTIFCKVFLKVPDKGSDSEIAFIDSTTMPVCHNARISGNKMFKGMAARGKTSVGWFYGFKLHLIIDENGDLINFALSKGNVSDNNKKIVGQLTENFTGKLFGDKGYLSSKLFEELYEKGITLVTKIRSNMKNKIMDIYDKIMLKKRPVIESAIDILKNIFQLYSTRFRSISNFFVNSLAAIAAYIFKPSKPHISLPNLFID